MKVLKKTTGNNVKSSIVRSSAVGLSTLMLSSFFLAGCGGKQAQPANGNPQPTLPPDTTTEDETAMVSIENQQEVVEYLGMKPEKVVTEATRIATATLYDGLTVTKYSLGGLSIYAGADGAYYIFDGDKKIKVDIVDGQVALPDGYQRYSVEGFATPMDWRVGTAKAEYEALQQEYKNLDKSKLTKPMLVYDGVQFVDAIGTNTMLKTIDGKIMINLPRLAQYLGFNYSDNGYGDVTDAATLEDNKNLESVKLSGYNGALNYMFIKNSNRVIVDSDAVTKYIAKEAEKNGTEITTKYMNVGEDTTVTEGSIVWIPVDYLSTVFGITYNIDGQVVTMESGDLLPMVKLFDTVETVVGTGSLSGVSSDLTTQSDAVDAQVNPETGEIIGAEDVAEVSESVEATDGAGAEGITVEEDKTVKAISPKVEDVQEQQPQQVIDTKVVKEVDIPDAQVPLAAQQASISKKDTTTLKLSIADVKGDKTLEELGAEAKAMTSDMNAKDTTPYDYSKVEFGADFQTELKRINREWIQQYLDKGEAPAAYPGVTWTGENSKAQGRIRNVAWIQGKGILIQGYAMAITFPESITGRGWEGEEEDWAWAINDAIDYFGIPDAGEMSIDEIVEWFNDSDNYYLRARAANDQMILASIYPLAFKYAHHINERTVNLSKNGRAFFETVNNGYGRGLCTIY